MSSNNQKSWLSIDNQIQLLKNRNLTIDNDSYARNILNRISYYRLISYRFPFCDKTNKNNFKNGTKIEDLVSLYNKDSEYQSILYQVLKEIEVLLRTQLIYCFSRKDYWFYKDKKNFDNSNDKEKEKTNSYMKKMSDSISNNNNIHLSYYIEQHNKSIYPYKLSSCNHNYTFQELDKKNKPYKSKCKCYPPAWVSLESFDFGMLIDLYAKINSDMISNKNNKYLACELEFSKFFNIDIKYLSKGKAKNPLLNLLRDIKVIRNIVAHHDKILDRYSFKATKSIGFLKKYYVNNSDILKLLNQPNKYKETFLVYFLVIKYFLDILFKNDPNLGYQKNIFTNFLDISKLNKHSLYLDDIPDEIFEPF